MDKPLALVIAFFIIFFFLSGCTMKIPLTGNVTNGSTNAGARDVIQPSSNGSNDTIAVGNVSRRAPPPLPE
jgi:hypothetical protein